MQFSARRTKRHPTKRATPRQSVQGERLERCANDGPCVPEPSGRYEFYSGPKQLSKRLAKLAGFDAFLAGLVRDCVNLVLNQFLLLFELLDLIGDGRHGITMIGIDAARGGGIVCFEVPQLVDLLVGGVELGLELAELVAI